MEKKSFLDYICIYFNMRVSKVSKGKQIFLSPFSATDSTENVFFMLTASIILLSSEYCDM